MVKKKVYKRLPGGTTVVRFKKRKPSKAACAGCGAVLHGVARGTNTQRKHMTKSSKRPERPFGGMLCSKCSRKQYKQSAREDSK
ncbi:50S ribosomal protein L34e [archaeon]|nr:50S ribosomal protein L34e [archaeon]